MKPLEELYTEYSNEVSKEKTGVEHSKDKDTQKQL